jgi:hypothetical protein
VDADRSILVTRADGSSLECGYFTHYLCERSRSTSSRSQAYTPGETLTVRLSDPVEGEYAEHVVEIDSDSDAVFEAEERFVTPSFYSVENATFCCSGCEGRRTIGQFLRDGPAAEKFAARVRTSLRGAPLIIRAGWQRTMGSVKLPTPCELTASAGGDPNAPKRGPSAAPSNMPSKQPHKEDL